MATRRRRSSPLARLAAPVAFLLAATIALLLVRSALHEGDRGGARDRPAAAETERRSTPPPPRRRRGSGNAPTRTADERRFYRVAPNDTLETIASAHGTTVEALLELNPAIDDPRTLTVGQQVRVR